jgi:hypothetical protein
VAATVAARGVVPVLLKVVNNGLVDPRKFDDKPRGLLGRFIEATGWWGLSLISLIVSLIVLRIGFWFSFGR